MKLFDLDKFSEIVQTITKNKTRSFLTAFGVFWGIFMLVVLIGGGNGLNYMLTKQIGGFATNTGLISDNRTGEAYMGFRKGRWWSLRTDDIQILKSNVPEIDKIAPMIFGGGTTVRGEKTGDYNIKGNYPVYQEIQTAIMLRGRYINDIDIQENRKVCVIGERVYEGLFNRGEDPIGQYIKCNGVYYQVVGVSKPISENISIGGDENETIVLPFTTMQKAFRLGDRVHLVAFTMQKGHSVASAKDDIERIIKQRHRISPTDTKAVDFMNIEQEFNLFNNLFLGISILIWIVGLGTLLAGVIGVSNIMMVTVKERTQEIGVRRALGAKPRQIVSQILSETALLTGIAGIFGIAFGVLILQLADLGFSGGGGETSGFMIPFWTAITAAVVLLSLSILAGLAPAWRAMQIKAIDALRDE